MDKGKQGATTTGEEARFSLVIWPAQTAETWQNSIALCLLLGLSKTFVSPGQNKARQDVRQ